MNGLIQISGEQGQLCTDSTLAKQEQQEDSGVLVCASCSPSALQPDRLGCIAGLFCVLDLDDSLGT